jgi:hypothetical protein
MTDYTELHDLLRRGAPIRDVRGWVISALSAVAEGRVPISAIRHPLGFVCLPVYRQGPDGICVHAWGALPPGAPLTTSPVHCHSWELLSCVLYGSVHNTVVSLTEVAEPPAQRVFEVHSAAGVDEIRASGRLVRCEEPPPELYRRGDVYRLEPGMFHTTTAPGGEAITVALGRQVPGGADLALGDPATPAHRVRREHCGEADTGRAAEFVLRRLAPGSLGQPARPGRP